MRRTAAILIVTQLVWGSACATKTPVTLASSPAAASQATQVVGGIPSDPSRPSVGERGVGARKRVFVAAVAIVTADGA